MRPDSGCAADAMRSGGADAIVMGVDVDMKSKRGQMMRRKTILAGAGVVMMMLSGGLAFGAPKEAAPNPFEETMQVEGQSLVLNGLGPYSVNRVKIYNVGIYVPGKKTTVPEILALPGVVRARLIMTKTETSEIMSRRFIADIRANTTKDDRIGIAQHLLTLGNGFGSLGDWTQGSIMDIDWLPGKGMYIAWNGKQVSGPMKEPLIMQSILRIWLGDNVYDSKLKSLLLGVKE